jgi:hypothetical protein
MQGASTDSFEVRAVRSIDSCKDQMESNSSALFFLLLPIPQLLHLPWSIKASFQLTFASLNLYFTSLLVTVAQQTL